jgi:diguanylate cyclase (GGDEF)-like protein
MLDIDHFKRVNDTFGHICGDQVLSTVAQRCRNAMRETDIVGRYGGEEFVILLPATPLDTAYDIAERLRHQIADEPVQTDAGLLAAVTISLGIATTVAPNFDLEHVLGQADAALFAAKRYGRNRVCTTEEPLAPDLIDAAENA